MKKETMLSKKSYSRLMVNADYTFSSTNASSSSYELVEDVRNNIMGDNMMFQGPYGDRKLTYCDYTASGKSVLAIENFIRDVILPTYANTHTTTSQTGHQTTLLRHEARLLIKRCVNANFSHGNDKDCLLFHGTGVTGCLNALIKILDVDKKRDEPAVVFTGPFEHHSNILPWREAQGCDVVTIKMTAQGTMDLEDLKSRLNEYGNRQLKIGSFSAASNVTGLLTDVVAVASLLHKHGALAFFDYATAAPYVKIDMNPLEKTAYMDGVFISPHKFLGGPGTPGVMVLKKRLIKYGPPIEPGGGTVFFVTDENQRYLKKAEERLEGGTQDIIGSCRAALAFQLKSSIGEEWITQRETELRAMAVKQFALSKNIVILNGSDPNAHYLPIISFVIQHHSGRMLHYGFVCALLNDLFGIQTRGGCMCAGPFAERLLGMTQDQANEYEKALVAHVDSEILRPGFCRFNLHYTMTDETAKFVLDAIEWISENGWKIMPDYAVDRSTGEWYHPAMKKFPGRRWLGDLSFEGTMHYDANQRLVPIDHSVRDYFAAANTAVKNTFEKLKRDKRAHLTMVEGTESLRWFLAPQEASAALLSPSLNEEPNWCLGNSPLRTIKFAGSSCASTTPSSMSSVKDAAAQFTTTELDDFFGIHEGDEGEEDGETENKKEEDEPASSEITQAEGEVCMLRPGALRGNFDVEELKKEEIPALLKGVKWHDPPKKKIWVKTRRAIFEYGMIKPGDKVLVCVSGGKDSLSLLHTLHFLQSKLGKDMPFEIGAITVDPMTVSFDPRPLIPYMAALGVTYHYEQQPLIDAAKDANASSICSWCSRMKRGIIYNVARKNGYNVVAMGQHLDDLAESFMMSLWLNGKLRTQKACYMVDEGDLRFIRPFVFVREQHLKEFALEKKLPVISETCPACFSEPKERARLKTLLENQETIYPNMYYSMCAAMDPLLRNTPITEADHERKLEMDIKMGMGPAVMPGVLTRIAWIGAGVVLGLAFLSKK